MEERVGGEGADRVDPRAPRGGDGGRYHPCLLVAEHPPLAAVRVEGQDRQARVRREPAGERLVGDAYGGENPVEGDQFRNPGKRLVYGHQGHPQAVAREHHDHFAPAAKLREEFGVSGVAVPRRVHRLLVDGSGRHGRGGAVEAQARRLADVAVAGVPAGGARSAVGHPVGTEPGEFAQVEHAGARRGRRHRPRDRLHGKRTPGDRQAALHRGPIPEDQRTADGCDGRVGEGGGDDLRPDPGRIPHGYRDERFVHVVFSFNISASPPFGKGGRGGFALRSW